jgi:Polysaccharide pyruvyl transferase
MYMVKSIAEMHKHLEESRHLLLDVVGKPTDLTVFRAWGNRGDDLIYAGMRSLLRNLPYREYDIRLLDRVPPGRLAIISGGGSWCRPFHAMPAFLAAAESRFRRVIVFPSSFDTDEPVVRETLERTRALIFCRERRSYEEIRGMCEARLAHDTAFFFDFSPYTSQSHAGILHAFREDAEAAGAPIPKDNRDISDECESLDEWLWAISKHDVIRTDRAHVVIAAAMLGKQIEYRSSTYHKVQAIVDFCLPPALISTFRDGKGWTGRGIKRASADAPGPKQVGWHEVSQIQAELEESCRALEAIRNSWSWRVTSPFRATLDVLLAAKRLLASSAVPSNRR